MGPPLLPSIFFSNRFASEKDDPFVQNGPLQAVCFLNEWTNEPVFTHFQRIHRTSIAIGAGFFLSLSFRLKSAPFSTSSSYSFSSFWLKKRKKETRSCRRRIEQQYNGFSIGRNRQCIVCEEDKASGVVVEAEEVLFVGLEGDMDQSTCVCTVVVL